MSAKFFTLLISVIGGHICLIKLEVNVDGYTYILSTSNPFSAKELLVRSHFTIVDLWPHISFFLSFVVTNFFLLFCFKHISTFLSP